MWPSNMLQPSGRAACRSSCETRSSSGFVGTFSLFYRRGPAQTKAPASLAAGTRPGPDQGVHAAAPGRGWRGFLLRKPGDHRLGDPWRPATEAASCKGRCARPWSADDALLNMSTYSPDWASRAFKRILLPRRACRPRSSPPALSTIWRAGEVSATHDLDAPVFWSAWRAASSSAATARSSATPLPAVMPRPPRGWRRGRHRRGPSSPHFHFRRRRLPD